ncbi:hypothetical protein O181_005015 [Austropuccinia psidii MF-1]|uniref:Uncharacterized protein n=1 Tax=Austropuccinia psidii MF-1 TaxID=1389203 RepID=A0A9Q3BI55_9BASI|nr:hypothetical protein [Austropuccinia psidii MF-1]
MKEKVIDLLHKYKNAFATDKEQLCSVIGNELDIILNAEKAYQQLRIIAAYPAILKAREALEVHIKELIDLGVSRKEVNNEQVEIITPFIVAWNNGKSKMIEYSELQTPTQSLTNIQYPESMRH